MQLPRGTFREIKRGVRVSDLLEEIERIGFSGICTISYGTENVTLVFRSGKCILADFLGRHGDSAWDELRKADDQEIDAALSTLDEAQIQLSLEFNKSSRIVKTARPGAPGVPARGGTPVKTPADTPRKPVIHPPPVHPLPPVKSPPKHGVPQTPVPSVPEGRMRTPETAASHKPSISDRLPAEPPHAPAHEPVRARAPAATGATRHVVAEKHPDTKTGPEKILADTEESQKNERDTGVESEFESFDSMDLENVADKIRSDCKTMIKHLHLEHLMER